MMEDEEKVIKYRRLSLYICYALESGPAGFGLRSGWRAFTTMVMFGLKSASYWTQSAATAAIWDIAKHNIKANKGKM